MERYLVIQILKIDISTYHTSQTILIPDIGSQNRIPSEARNSASFKHSGYTSDELVRILGFTFPHYDYVPAKFLEISNSLPVPCDVFLELVFPETDSRLWCI